MKMLRKLRTQIRLFRRHRAFRKLLDPNGPYECPVCGARFSEFAPFKPSLSREARPAFCPACLALERTRMIALFFAGEAASRLRGVKMLHFAPEKGLEKRLRKDWKVDLVTTDLMMSRVDVKADITNLPWEDGNFGVIYCSNVLEHIPDDEKAMKELHRVLAPGGLAVIQVPIKGEKTYEDPSITTPEDRDKHFGQHDHVRYYGTDIKERLTAVGFGVEEVYMPDRLNLSPEDLKKFGIEKRELIHLCKKGGQ